MKRTIELLTGAAGSDVAAKEIPAKPRMSFLFADDRGWGVWSGDQAAGDNAYPWPTSR